MAYKKILSLIAILGLTLILSSCSSNTNPTIKEFNELKESTSIGDVSIIQIQDDMRTFVLKLYNPSSQKQLDECYNIIKPYSTDSLIEELRRATNSYKEGAEKTQEVVVKSVEFGSAKNQFDGMNKLLIDVEVRSEKYNDVEAFLEFSFNPDGKLFKYDIWKYSLEA